MTVKLWGTVNLKWGYTWTHGVLILVQKVPQRYKKNKIIKRAKKKKNNLLNKVDVWLSRCLKKCISWLNFAISKKNQDFKSKDSTLIYVTYKSLTGSKQTGKNNNSAVEESLYLCFADFFAFHFSVSRLILPGFFPLFSE